MNCYGKYWYFKTVYFQYKNISIYEWGLYLPQPSVVHHCDNDNKYYLEWLIIFIVKFIWKWLLSPSHIFLIVMTLFTGKNTRDMDSNRTKSREGQCFKTVPMLVDIFRNQIKTQFLKLTAKPKVQGNPSCQQELHPLPFPCARWFLKRTSARWVLLPLSTHLKKTFKCTVEKKERIKIML